MKEMSSTLGISSQSAQYHITETNGAHLSQSCENSGDTTRGCARSNDLAVRSTTLAPPCLLLCFALVTVWTENKNFTISDRWPLYLFCFDSKKGRQNCIRVTWIKDVLTSKWPGSFVPPLCESGILLTFLIIVQSDYKLLICLKLQSVLSVLDTLWYRSWCKRRLSKSSIAQGRQTSVSRCVYHSVSLFNTASFSQLTELSSAEWAALLLSCETGCSLYMIVYVYVYYMFVRLSGCLNHIKGTIIIIIIIIM